MTKNEAAYIKKVNSKKLSGSFEFMTSRLGWQVSGVFALYLAVTAFMAESVSTAKLIIAAVFAVQFLLQFFITSKITKELTGPAGAISDGTRKLGFLLVPFILCGNFCDARRRKFLPYKVDTC